jgi:hypothetical protein
MTSFIPSQGTRQAALMRAMPSNELYVEISMALSVFEMACNDFYLDVVTLL